MAALARGRDVRQEGEPGTADRFAFGENWRRFLDLLTDERISAARASLQDMLQRESLVGLSFLDIGSGSGLFSLAAKQLGAMVHSFDYDAQSVACTQELKRRYFPDDPAWVVERGSVLDAAFLDRIGQYDIVYSWGVLHHTGEMWKALGLAAKRVVPGGSLFIAIYNDEGGASNRWRTIKRAYNRAPGAIKPVIVTAVGAYFATKAMGGRILRGHVSSKRSKSPRGMDRRRDLVDWVGGYPFEVATPTAIFDFFRTRGFRLERMFTRNGIGCNEFVFAKERVAV